MGTDDGVDRLVAQTPGRPAVLLVEPLALYAECLRLALEVSGYAVTGQALTARDAVARFTAEPPVAVVCDLDLPAGREACRQVARRFHGAILIGLSHYEPTSTLPPTHAIGASAIVSKHAGLPALLAALRDVSLKRTPAPAAGTADWTRQTNSNPDAPFASLQALSSREREVARLIGHGLTNKEAARLLRVAPVTVRNHLSNAMGKLGARSRAEVAAMVALAGWLDDTEEA